MIRINLLPVRAAKKREYSRQVVGFLLLALIIALGANFVWWKQLSDEADQLDRTNGHTRQQIAQLEKTIGEVKSITQEKKALEDKLKILDNLKKGRTGPVRLMDELAAIIPNKVWLSTFGETGGKLALIGRAASYEELSTFSKKLKASKRFRDVVIVRASQAPDGIVDWSINCSADYSA
jgi:type IV pilus assembly protein PilN